MEILNEVNTHALIISLIIVGVPLILFFALLKIRSTLKDPHFIEWCERNQNK